jgi:hypothetical protein
VALAGAVPLAAPEARTTSPASQIDGMLIDAEWTQKRAG